MNHGQRQPISGSQPEITRVGCRGAHRSSTDDAPAHDQPRPSRCGGQTYRATVLLLSWLVVIRVQNTWQSSMLP
jgi:hypothetical protein